MNVASKLDREAKGLCIVKILKHGGHVRQIGHPELRDERPVIFDDDEDLAGIMLAETLENRILV